MPKFIKRLLGKDKIPYSPTSNLHRVLEICLNSGEYFTSYQIMKSYFYRHDEVVSRQWMMKNFYILERDGHIKKTGQRVGRGRGISVYTKA